jgi:Aspartyl protease
MRLYSFRFGVLAIGVCVPVLARGGPVTPVACQPQLVAVLPVTVSSACTMMVSGQIDGKAGSLMVDTGATFSMMRSAVADELGLTRDNIPNGVFGLGGEAIRQRARAHELTLGPIVEPDRGFLIAPSNMSVDPRAIGILGRDVIGEFDVEFDPQAQQMKLYKSGQCPSFVPGWAAGIVPTPVEITSDDQIVFRAEIDGKPVRAYLATGATYSMLDFATAKQMFDLDRKSPGMDRIGGTRTADGVTLDTYLYHFKSLKVAGVTFPMPAVSFIDARGRSNPGADEGLDADLGTLPAVRIGMHQLRQLHIYVAEGAHELYVAPVAPPR